MPAALIVGQQVDVQVGRVRHQLGPQHPLGVKQILELLLLGRHRRRGRWLIAPPHPGQPIAPVGSHELRGPGGADHVAHGALAVVKHVRVLRLQFYIRPGVDIRDEVIGAEQSASILARRSGADADVVDVVAVTGLVGTNRCVRYECYCNRTMRIGLAGTGYWARITHAPALISTDGIELAGVWGRNPAAAQALAGKHGVRSFADFDEFTEQVDAIAFAVPPDVQSPLALRAAAAGKHLLLEKPIALSVTDADALVEAVQTAGVASVVFFTSQFQVNVRVWLADVAARADWAGGSAVWLGSALQEASPFNTPWRREKGGLWDLGPHVVALLWKTLGQVVSVTADRGRGEVTHLVLHHQGGSTSSVSVTMDVPESAEFFELFVWGAGGRSVAPREAGDAVTPLRTALTELAFCAREGSATHPCDVTFGRDVVRVLAEAQRQLDAAGRRAVRP